MAFCESCGNPVYRLDRTCVRCGAPIQPDAQSARNGKQSPARMSDDFAPKTPYDVLSSWGFVGSILLMSLPFVGFIIMIVWATGSVSNLNRRNLARAYLLMMVIGFVISVVVGIIMVSSGIPVNQFYNRFFFPAG